MMTQPGSKCICCSKPIPPELKHSRHWCLWRYVDRGNGKFDKVPVTISGDSARINDPASFNSFENVYAAYRRKDCVGHGLNFAVTADHDFACIDLDGVVNADGTLEPFAESALRRFEDTFTEFSPSGRGLHVWLKLANPESARNIVDVKNHFEFFHQAHFMSIVGNPLVHFKSVEACHFERIESVYQEFFAGESSPIRRHEKAPTAWAQNILRMDSV